MAIPTSELQKINPSAVIELFELQLIAAIHGSDQLFRWHSGSNHPWAACCAPQMASPVPPMMRGGPASQPWVSGVDSVLSGLWSNLEIEEK